MTGARYQIAVDGQPRSNRDDRAIAIEAAEYLSIKYKHSHARSPFTIARPATRAPSRPCRPVARYDPRTSAAAAGQPLPPSESEGFSAFLTGLFATAWAEVAAGLDHRFALIKQFDDLALCVVVPDKGTIEACVICGATQLTYSRRVS